MSLRDDEYVHVRSLIASIHRPKNVARPPELAPPNSPASERGSPASSDTDRSGTGSDLSDIRTKDEVVHAPRSKSNSIAGTSLAPPGPGQQEERRRRRPSLLHLQTERGGPTGPQSAGPYLTVPRFTVTAPPGEQHHRRFSHAFHGFALRRHSNTSLHRSESMLSLAYYKTLAQLVNDDNTAELQQYLANNKNINVDDRDENNATALMVASERGRAEAVRLLVAAGADPNATDADGWGPVPLAARAGHAPVVRELLDAGAKVDPRDCGGWTPLMWASYKGHEEVVAFLLEKGADVHAHGNYNINSLVWAAGRRHSGVVAQLLTAGARPNSCDKYATSALTWAARAGDTASCAALLRAGADPNTAGMYCWTPLLQATHGNHFEIVQMLLEHKPNVNALDKDGFTALAIACKEGYYDIALALINSGAYINIQDHSKDTPLIHAVKGGHKNIVEALLKKHVDVDLQGKDKKTPVYTAVEKGHISILKLLLASNPDLELTTNTGDTPLLRAVRSRNSEMVQLLLERKARVTATDHRGDTALHIAMRARSRQIVEILLRNPKHSQLLYKPNKQNETPYNIDMSYNKTILGQIFGARKINTNEDAENMLGYELYSAALADMLSEPSLSVPITVGLYARWGSGKSFLLSKLKEEMKNFARQWSETGWSWSWAVAWAAWHAALFVGAVTTVAGAAPHAAVAVCFALFAAFYLALYLFWNLGNKYEWWWAGGVLTAMGRRFSSLLLILQVVFCHPPGPNDPRALPAMPIRFHFTEGMKSGGGQEGETMVVQMIASLAEALECQYGRVCTRLARAFKPSPMSSTSGWRWRRVCCVPHIITFELCFTTILVGLCVLVLYLIERNVEEERREIQQGLMIGACALAAVVVLANLYTWGRVLGALLLGPRFRLMRALKRDAPTLALRPEVQALTHMVSCLDAFTGQQTRLVVVVDALDSCEQDKVLALLNAVHALCSDPGSPFILLLAIDPHIISKAVEVNSKRAFSESNIGGWDYLRNMVQLPFYLQNSALRRVKIAQQMALRRMQTANAEDFASLQRSVSARRLSSTSELMSSQERIKPQATKDASGGSTTAASRARRLRPSESVASSMASGLHRAGAPPGGAADLGRVLLTDDYFSDVNPRSMRRLMNVLYITGRLLKAFQIEFNWYQLASWVNLTEQWPFRTSWIIYHHETYEEHIDDSTSLKKIYEKVRPNMNSLRETGALAELDRDERKLEVFLNFHRSTLTAADLKIFLPFTINLDPYIKKVIKEEQMQAGAEDELGTTGAFSMPWTTNQSKHPHSKLFQRKHKLSAPITQSVASSGVTPPMWMGWPNIGPSYGPPSLFPPMGTAPATNPITVLKTAFPDLGDVSSLRLSTLSVEQVCVLVRAALGSDSACAILQQHHICGMVLTHCDLRELRPVLDLPFGDWELFKMLITNLRELENNMPTNTPSVTVLSEKNVESEPDAVKPRPVLEHQRSRTSNMEKQVTLEEQMICGALQTLNEEALEDVLQADPAPDEDSELQLPLPVSVSSFGGNSTNASPLGTPRGPRREISILKGGSFRRRAPALPDPPAVTFNVENEEDSDDGHITFSARPCLRAPSARPLAVTVQYAAPVPRPVVRSRPSSLLVTYDDAGELSENGPLATRSRSVEDSIKNSPAVDFKLRNIRKTADILKKVGSAERLTKLKEKIMSVGTGSRDRSPAREDTISDDESAPLVSPGIISPMNITGGPAADAPCLTVRSMSSLHSKSAQNSPTKKITILGIECREPSLQDCTQSTEFSPRSEISQLDSPRETLLDFDILPEAKTGSNSGESQSHRNDIIREESQESMSNMIEPYNMRLLAHGTSETGRALWRQDAIDAGPPWPWDDPDSAV